MARGLVTLARLPLLASGLLAGPALRAALEADLVAEKRLSVALVDEGDAHERDARRRRTCGTAYLSSAATRYTIDTTAGQQRILSILPTRMGDRMIGSQLGLRRK